MSTDLIMSPSLYKDWKTCNRKALINSHRFLGNIHTVYGRAYEDGAKVVIELLTEFQAGKGDIYGKASDKPNLAEEIIVGKAILKASAYLINFSLDIKKEKNVFTLATGLLHTYYWFKNFLMLNDVTDYEERLIFKGANFTIGGAYDLIANRKGTTLSSIYDFKGITSLWNYSFESSPQIPIYTVLKQMALIAKGSSDTVSMNGGYLINMTSAKKDGEPFIYIPVNTRLVVNNLEGMMEDFITCAKELEKLQVSTNVVSAQYMNARVGLDHCTANFNCYNLRECENRSFGTVTHPDDRVFDKLTEYTFSTGLLKEAIKKLRANSTMTNLVDGEGIAKGGEISRAALDDYYSSDTPLSINEL